MLTKKAKQKAIVPLCCTVPDADLSFAKTVENEGAKISYQI